MLLSHLAAFERSSLSPHFSSVQSKRIATYRFNDLDRDSDVWLQVVSFQIQHKGVSFVERARTPFQKISVPCYSLLNFSGKNQCTRSSQLAFLFMYYGFDLQLQGQCFLGLIILFQSVYFTVPTTAGTNVPYHSYNRYSAELLKNVGGLVQWLVC